MIWWGIQHKELRPSCSDLVMPPMGSRIVARVLFQHLNGLLAATATTVGHFLGNDHLGLDTLADAGSDGINPESVTMLGSQSTAA